MKTLKLTIFSILLLSASFACEKTEVYPVNESRDKLKSTQGIIASDNEFGLDLFKEVISNEPEDVNVFISPVSISMALAMTYNGANGTTEEAMRTTLKKEDYSIAQINTLYKSLMEGLLSVDPKVILEIANSIWYREEFSVEQNFLDVNSEYYAAEVASLNFGASDAKNIINNWVADKTHDKIEEIIDNIPPEAVMYLINAIYFKGTWKYEFNIENTTDEYFTCLNSNIKQVPSMKQQEDFYYLSNNLFSAAELPYGQGDYSMLVLLPNADKTVQDVINELTVENWENWTESLSNKNVIVQLPKFKFEYKKKLNEDLSDLGMGIAFSGGADFSKINPVEPLFISTVLHKSFVEVNEEGTEAAAVTSVEISLTSISGETPAYFIVNRPFLFVIKEKNSSAILFIGRVMDPVL
ncbi:MAG: serpin family protein [Bacteroidales bacterium]|nr:serpin family protein [Bacteroidales bacterium]